MAEIVLLGSALQTRDLRARYRALELSSFGVAKAYLKRADDALSLMKDSVDDEEQKALGEIAGAWLSLAHRFSDLHPA